MRGFRSIYYLRHITLVIPHHVELVCYAYAPPGSMLTEDAAVFTESFITSVVIGQVSSNPTLVHALFACLSTEQ